MKVLQLSGKDFGGDCACLGPQVASIIRMLAAMPDLEQCAWYAGAIDTIPTFAAYVDNCLVKVEDLAALIELINASVQLLDGIIVAIPPLEAPITVWPRMTADGPIEAAASNSALEIHAFDTSYIEVYAKDPEVISSLQASFGGKILDSEY